MERKIKSVEKLWGKGSTFFSTDQAITDHHRVDEIKEEVKQVNNDLMINLYVGYKNKERVFDIEINTDVKVCYW
jgi:hypothetical protein